MSIAVRAIGAAMLHQVSVISGGKFNHCLSKDQYSELVFQEKMNSLFLNNLYFCLLWLLSVIQLMCKENSIANQYTAAAEV